MILRLALLVCIVAALGCGDRGAGSETQVAQVTGLDADGLRKLLDDPAWKDDLYVLAAVAQSPRATTDILDRIARKGDPRLHQKLFGTPAALGKNQKGLAVMRLVARHPNVSQATLERLARSPDEYVISDVLANSKTPEAVLRDFGDRDSYLTDWGIAQNPKAPPELLHKRASSKNEYTRSFVARNPNTPVVLLSSLARDASWTVRRDVTLHPGVPRALLEQLAQDSDQRVRLSAEHELKKR